MKRNIILILLAVLCLTSLAQKNSTLYWFGYVKSEYEHSFAEEKDNSGEFDVLLSGLGLVADINDFSQAYIFVYGNYPGVNGVDSTSVVVRDYIGVLDVEARFKPIENLQLTLGQFVTPFAQEHYKSSSKIDFIKRGYVVANSPSYRDIGVYIKYKIPIVTAYASLTNGSGMNTFDGNKYKNFSVWAEVKPIEGLKVMGGTSIGKDNASDSLAEDQRFYSAGLSFSYGHLGLTSEMSIKDYRDQTSDALYAYGYYDIPISSDILHWITPGFRYDYLDPPLDLDKTDRYTFGLAFHFDESKWLSMLRINYEMIDGESTNPPDNLIVELQMRFD
ncbi:outer membrane beta-barrel protein [bacterium]|nr:outer membrane beta-barrel protein [bacterium]